MAQMTTEQEVERRQKIDIARAKQLHERTPEERILAQEADLADAQIAARAATEAANKRQQQYENETFLLRNPSFVDNQANVERLKSLLAAKGWGYDAKSMEFVFRNNIDSFVTSKPAAAPPTEPAPAKKTYDLRPEVLAKITPAEMTEIRRRDKPRYDAITEALSDLIAKVGGGLARKIMNGQELTETEQIKLAEAYR
jgi:hypothetical protein